MTDRDSQKVFNRVFAIMRMWVQRDSRKRIRLGARNSKMIDMGWHLLCFATVGGSNVIKIMLFAIPLKKKAICALLVPRAAVKSVIAAVVVVGGW